MFPLDQLIHCKRYQEICDQNWGRGDEITGNVVHVDMDSIPEFFDKLRTHPKKVVVVSSCCDFGLCYQQEYPVYSDISKAARMFVHPSIGYDSMTLHARCDKARCRLGDKYSIKCYSYTSCTFPEIPKNVVKWYMTNGRVFNDHRIENIPFGVNGTDGIECCKKVADYPINSKRDIDIYVNFGFHTFERVDIYQYYQYVASQFPFNIVVEQEKDYEHYLNMLSRSKYVLCPAGNGVDCFRNLEALYMGAIPVFESKDIVHAAYVQNTYLNLASYFLEPDFIGFLLKISDKYTPASGVPQYTINYWKNRFYSHLIT